MTIEKKAKRPRKQCWICNKLIRKYAQKHHVLLRINDQDLTVTLCRGCHYLVGLLAQRIFLNDAHKVADLLTLARFQAGLPDARTVVNYEYTG